MFESLCKSCNASSDGHIICDMCRKRFASEFKLALAQSKRQDQAAKAEKRNQKGA